MVGGSQAGISTTIATTQRGVNDIKEAEGIQMILQELRSMKQKIETLVVDQETLNKKLDRVEGRKRHDDGINRLMRYRVRTAAMVISFPLFMRLQVPIRKKRTHWR